jgi:hypothetical protein
LFTVSKIKFVGKESIMFCVLLASKPAWKWDADDSADLFGHHSGKFSAERGLFDDLDDSTVSLWGSKDKVTADKGTCE